VNEYFVSYFGDFVAYLCHKNFFPKWFLKAILIYIACSTSVDEKFSHKEIGSISVFDMAKYIDEK